jgi:hypothetical protein
MVDVNVVVVVLSWSFGVSSRFLKVCTKEQKLQKVMGSVAPMQSNGVAARRIPNHWI